MQLMFESYIKGSFRGWHNRETLFEFGNGQVWRQNEYLYEYKYKYRPKAKLFQDVGTYYLEVEGMNKKIKVKRVK